jgi:hypothetical protein
MLEALVGLLLLVIVFRDFPALRKRVKVVFRRR